MQPLADRLRARELAVRILRGWLRTGRHMQPLINMALLGGVSDMDQAAQRHVSRALRHLSTAGVVRYRPKYRQWELTEWRATAAGAELLRDAYNTVA